MDVTIESLSRTVVVTRSSSALAAELSRPTLQVTLNQRGPTGPRNAIDMAFDLPGETYQPGEVLLTVPFGKDYAFLEPGSVVEADNAPTDDCTIAILDRSDPWGALEFAGGDPVGVVVMLDGQAPAGTKLRFVAPTPADPTLGNVAGFLAGA